MSATNYSVLIVDDEPSIRTILSKRLEFEGFNTATADNGAAAIEILKIEHFDVILLDLVMPEVNGYQVLEWLLQENLLDKSSVIILSAGSDRDQVTTTLTMGAKDYLLKSASKAEIVNRIYRFCHARKHATDNPDEKTSRNNADFTILIVDDMEQNRMLLSKRFSILGFNTFTAENGVNALSVIKKQPVDLVLLDINMPEMNGIDVLQQLRSDENYSDTGIIMVSGLEDTDKIAECYELGADDYISKPYNSAEIIARVNAILHSRIISSREEMRKNRLDEFLDMHKKIASAHDG